MQEVFGRVLSGEVFGGRAVIELAVRQGAVGPLVGAGGISRRVAGEQ